MASPAEDLAPLVEPWPLWVPPLFWREPAPLKPAGYVFAWSPVPLFKIAQAWLGSVLLSSPSPPVPPHHSPNWAVSTHLAQEVPAPMGN